jgi:hypothetical protein
MEPEFPLEFMVEGTPVSAQAERARSREEWKQRVRDASIPLLPEGHWASTDRISVTLFYFPRAPMQGDVDNIIKLVLDAMMQHIYVDDHQIERVVVQKFEPDNVFQFSSPSDTLARAMQLADAGPVLYVRVSNDPFEDLS